jgi:RNA recognition motif-containing protein
VAKTLVISNLPSKTTEVMIKNFLFRRGTILSIDIFPVQDHQEGFAYVELDSEKDAANVVRTLNNNRLHGQQVGISRIDKPFV